MREEKIKKVSDLVADKVAGQVSEMLKSVLKGRNETDEDLKLYTVKNICVMLHISRSKLYRHQKMGLISPTQYVGRTPLYSRQTIEKYLDSFK